MIFYGCNAKLDVSEKELFGQSIYKYFYHISYHTMGLIGDKKCGMVVSEVDNKKAPNPYSTRIMELLVYSLIE